MFAQDSEALRLGRVRYNVGATDLLDVLQLQTRQLDSNFELIGVRADRLANRVALHLALGGGFAPPAAGVSWLLHQSMTTGCRVGR